MEGGITGVRSEFRCDLSRGGKEELKAWGGGMAGWELPRKLGTSDLLCTFNAGSALLQP